jgi:hypothetical protein
VKRVRRALWRVLKWPLVAGTIVLVLLCLPVAYVELACRGDATAQAGSPLITDPQFHRREANTYLTYPEWHIVYAYDDLAKTLIASDEYAFPYFSSIAGFWSSTCALMRTADGHGGADWGTRSMIHTIGVSFTLEMAIKATYEETIGRATAWWRGGVKTPQDKVITAMAANYAAFLRQTPWYEYPFTREAAALWAAPTDGFVRGWERTLGIGAEFLAKAAYAKVLGAAAAAAPAQLEIRSIVSGLDRTALATIPDVTVIAERDGRVEIETPRYAQFTRILVEVARRGGTVLDIAGNDDIMVSLTVPEGASPSLAGGTVLLRMGRSGVPGERLLVNVKVTDLATLINAHPLGDPGLEHIFDY